MKKFAMMLALALPLAFASCGDDDPVTSISLDKTAEAVDYGKTVTLSADVKKVNWSSSNEFVATVDGNGVVTAKHVGTATITAEKDGASASCKVTVNPVDNSFALPILNWGASLTSVKNSVTDMTLLSESSSILMYAADASYAYPWYTYSFGTSGLRGSMISLTTDMDEEENFQGWLEQYFGYYTIDEDNNLAYINASDIVDATIGVTYGYDADLDLVNATFVPVTSNTRGTVFDLSAVESLREAVKEAKK
ncbi:MAG: Ig-like domain-containing protein [Muribaculaceae bacterium]|nr:Ig-like domain-containing protein [Muribaculaceae bacterium]